MALLPVPAADVIVFVVVAETGTAALGPLQWSAPNFVEANPVISNAILIATLSYT